MKFVKLISILLAVLMLVGSLVIVASADSSAEEEETTAPVYTMNTGDGKSLMMKDASNPGQYLYREGKAANGKVISTPEEKLAVMDLRYETASFRLYVDAYSGEVAIQSKDTGEALFTNPYNIGQSTATGDVPEEILSQIIINYSDIKDNSTGKFYSYTWAALRNQIKVKNIKGGLRVEYTLGREETRSLLPHMMESSKWEAMVATMEANMSAAIAAGGVSDPEEEEFRLFQFKNYYEEYSLQDAYDENGQFNEAIYNEYIATYPIFETKADITFYAINESGLGERVTKKLESLIKEYYPEYTYEMLEADHEEVGFVAEIEIYPLFKLALEYTVDDKTGLIVRLPANGIRFDETLYRLDSINILPYMGAGMNPNKGYTFFPDGSGTLFSFEDIAKAGKRVQVSSKVYGQDYAYHQITGMYEEVVRYPVFGIYEEKQLQKQVDDGNGGTVTENYTKGTGFVAIIEEGDSLMELSTYHGGRSTGNQNGQHEYNTIMMSAMPRPTDSYNMADAISVGTNTTWTVVSARKYTGSYTVRYIMLTDDKVAEEKGVTDYYETSYTGMAKAYRDYLEANGTLTRIQQTEENKNEDIPLYIETFGALETTERFLSIPVKVMTALTTFEDITTMYNDLKNNGITNVNFIMTGYTKGGLTGERVPYKLKWEKAVSKEMDFEELNEYARTNNFGIFPDFDFVFSSNDTLFDGLSLNKHAAKTIDDRYTSKREYSATKHTYVSYYELALSSAYFSHFYEKFIEKYKDYNPVGISVSTLGSYLNSDFDEDEPYNRADSKMYTEKALSYINENLPNTEIMTSGGNAYSWKFVDHITDISLDSSRFTSSSASVPFLGMVLHGYVEIAGTPVNMEGNLDYAFLKAVESGASLKFILSYKNTEELKEYETLSRYYSVDYSIWFNNGEGDLVSMYKELNSILKSVKNSVIIGHEFIDGTRIPDNDELRIDAEQALKDAIAYETALKNAKDDAEREAIYQARQLIVKALDAINGDPELINTLADNVATLKAIYDGKNGELATLLENATNALEEYKAFQQYHAIFSDRVNTTTLSADNATKAYEAYIAADPSDADYAELKAEYKKQLAIVGQEFIDAYVEMAPAKNAVEAFEDYLTAKQKLETAEKNLATAADRLAKADPNSSNYNRLQATYDRAVATLKTRKTEFAESETALGETLAVLGQSFVDAWDAIAPYKQALDDANAGEDEAAITAAKEAYEAKLTEFEELLNAEYELKSASYNEADIGIGLDAKELVDAMKKLEPYKQAWIDANASGDAEATAAAKATFESKLAEIYDPLLNTGVVYEITFGGERVGGSRWWRDNAKTVYEAATTALDEKITEFFTLSNETFAKTEVFTDLYNIESLEEAIALLEASNAYTADERAALKAIVAEIKAFLADNGLTDKFKNMSTHDINAAATKAYELYKKLYEMTDAAGKQIDLGDLVDYEISGLKASSFLTASEYTWTEQIVEEEPVEITKPTLNTDKYKSDANMIVHETFDNGIEFILNFNDYRVVVELDGTQYVLDAYGYVVLNGTNAQ